MIPDDESSIIQSEGLLPSGQIDSVQLDMSQVCLSSQRLEAFLLTPWFPSPPDHQAICHRLGAPRYSYPLQLPGMEEVLQVHHLGAVRDASGTQQAQGRRSCDSEIRKMKV